MTLKCFFAPFDIGVKMTFFKRGDTSKFVSLSIINSFLGFFLALFLMISDSTMEYMSF